MGDEYDVMIQWLKKQQKKETAFMKSVPSLTQRNMELAVSKINECVKRRTSPHERGAMMSDGITEMSRIIEKNKTLRERVEATTAELNHLKEIEGAAFDAQNRIGEPTVQPECPECEKKDRVIADLKDSFCRWQETIEARDDKIARLRKKTQPPTIAEVMKAIYPPIRKRHKDEPLILDDIMNEIKSRLEALPSEPPVIKESLTTQEVLALVGEAMRNVGDLNLKTRATILTELKRLLAERGVTYDPERLEHFAAWWNTVIPDDERKIRDQHLGDYFNEYPQPERNPAPFDRRALLMEFAKRMQSTKYVFLYSRESLVDAFLAEHQPDEAPSEEQAK